MFYVRVIRAIRGKNLVAHASRECNRYELIENCARKCLAALGRPDIGPLVARQGVALPTLWA